MNVGRLSLFIAATIFSAQRGPAAQNENADSATVYVYRAKAAIKGIALHPSVYIDGAEITRIHRGTFSVTRIAPGKHIVTLGRTEVGQFIDSQPGGKYFFRFGHKNIFVTSLANREPLTLTPVPEATALREMDGLKKQK